MVSMIPEGTLAYGMQLPVQSQSTLYAEPWEADAGAAELARLARACDEAGFLYVAVCDHVAIPREKADAMGTSWWDTMTTLGYLAGITQRVRLMSHVAVVPYRHPLMTAKAFLTLDAVSSGRAILGAGAGHVEAEFAALGADFATRGRVLDDALEVVAAAFADEYPKVQNSHFDVHDVGLRPRPVQVGGPPVWIGGSSPAAMRRAVRCGDGWLPQGPPKQGMKQAIRDLREALAADGRVRAHDFVIGGNAEPIHLGTPSFEVEPHCLTGSAETVAERLRRYRDNGVQQVQVRFRSRSCDEAVDQIRAFGQDVAPLLVG